MKKTIFSFTFIFLAFCIHARDSSTKTDTFKVWGNCGMCEKRIETAASAVKGVSQADWDADKGVMILVYDPSETNIGIVQKAIAAVGYDTEIIKGDDKAYSRLSGCCQYDRKNK